MASSLVTSVIQWLGSILVQEASMLFEVEDQVQSLQQRLELMQQYLQDADAKQEVMEISALVTRIRKLSFDIEDIIDTYILEVETKGNGSQSKGRFWNFACFLRRVPQTYVIGKQIQSIESDVRQITGSLINYGVSRVINVGNDQEISSNHRQQSYPYDDEGGFIVGLEKDIASLVQVLMGEGMKQVRLVSIVGMGGTGKTTLARKLYNHPYAKECFDCRAWVCVSQEFSTRDMLLEMHRMVSTPMEISNVNDKSSVAELVDKLRSILENKSYLVVLDDVWKEDALVQILPAFPWLNNSKGSKIIITTRNQKVVQYQNLQRHLYIHESRPLNEEESWELFCKIAFNYHTTCNEKNFEALGKEMLKKCDGLPLAIVTLAGILNTKRSISEWQIVSEAVCLRIMEGTCTHMYGRVGEMLALSYDDLPYDLKPCFLYLSVFPEDCIIPAGMLTRMWIAESFVTSNELMCVEDVAMQRLEELKHRFMIQVVKTNFRGAIKAIRLHDLLYDICVRKAKEQKFLGIYPSKNLLVPYDASKVSIHSRRAALHSSTQLPEHISKLRSLVVLTRSTVMHSAYVSKESLDLVIVHENFKLLRLLNLWGIKTPTGALPAEIGSLIHLRYLGIRASNIIELPTSLGNLRNLLTLDYRNIDSDVDVIIPNVFYKLTLLRHLYLPIKCRWHAENLEFSPLKNLQILWGLKSTGNDWFAREMFDVSRTLRKLKVVVSTYKDLEAAFGCQSVVSDGLHTFHCKWSNGIALRLSRVFPNNQHLHKLVLIGAISVEKLILPSNILVLELKDSVLRRKDHMIIAGALPHLKILRLLNSYIGTAFTSSSGSFPQLEELYLENLRNLDSWSIEKGAMPTLRKLEILRCQKLQFPPGLVYITNLQQFDFYLTSKKFSKQAREYGWSQERLRLPHNLEAIIKQCDNSINVSSIHKLYEQLASGIFLDDKRKKFWVKKHEDYQYNCFMVYAINLHMGTKDGTFRPNLFVRVDECDFLSPFDNNDPSSNVLKWMEIEERDGTFVKVAKLMPGEYVHGSFNLKDLSPSGTYTFSFVIMLDDSESVEDLDINTTLQLPGQKPRIQTQKLFNKPRNEWIKVLIGELKTRPNAINEVAEFFMSCYWRERSKLGFSVKGVVIEPKV